MYRLIVLSTVLLFSFGCSSQQQIVDTDYHHSNPQVEKVLQKAFAASGGFDRYQNLKSLSYKKRTKLYLPDGSIGVYNFSGAFCHDILDEGWSSTLYKV